MTDTPGPDTDATPSDDAETPPEPGTRQLSRKSPKKTTKKPRKRGPSNQKRAKPVKKGTTRKTTRKAKRTTRDTKPKAIDPPLDGAVSSPPVNEPPVSAPPIMDVAALLLAFTLLGNAELQSAFEPPKQKRGRGRPKHEPTAESIGMVERLASLGLTLEETSYAIGVHRETFNLYRDSHYSDAIKSGKARGRITSGAVLMREMLAGNMTALIWYEKTRLGMTEKVHTLVSNPDGGPVESNVHHSGSVAIGLYLPPNGRDVLAEGQRLPTRNPLELPPNAREVATVDVDPTPGKKGKQ